MLGQPIEEGKKAKAKPGRLGDRSTSRAETITLKTSRPKTEPLPPVNMFLSGKVFRQQQASEDSNLQFVQ